MDHVGPAVLDHELGDHAFELARSDACAERVGRLSLVSQIANDPAADVGDFGACREGVNGERDRAVQRTDNSRDLFVLDQPAHLGEPDVRRILVVGDH
jgi:hypothetical protein